MARWRAPLVERMPADDRDRPTGRAASRRERRRGEPEAPRPSSTRLGRRAAAGAGATRWGEPAAGGPREKPPVASDATTAAVDDGPRWAAGETPDGFPAGEAGR